MDQSRGQVREARLLATVASLVVPVIAFGGAAVYTGDDGVNHHDGWTGSHSGAFGYLWTTLWMLVPLGAPLGLGYLFLSRRDSGGEASDDALTVLRRRYAEGETDEEEFDARRRKLQVGE